MRVRTRFGGRLLVKLKLDRAETFSPSRRVVYTLMTGFGDYHFDGFRAPLHGAATRFGLITFERVPVGRDVASAWSV